MKHNLLIDHLNKYGKISEDEEKSIRKYFIQLETEKKQILIKEHSPCNKLFFVNSGFIRAKIIKVNTVIILTSVEFELVKTFISIFFT